MCAAIISTRAYVAAHPDVVDKYLRAMIQGARRGDTIVTSGGLIGKISKATDDTEVELEIAPNIKVRVARSGISEVRSKGEPVKDAPSK